MNRLLPVTLVVKLMPPGATEIEKKNIEKRKKKTRTATNRDPAREIIDAEHATRPDGQERNTFF